MAPAHMLESALPSEPLKQGTEFMTYCLGMNLDAGMIFASDSRTNAGVDNVAKFDKMRVFAKEGERVVVTLSAGNLSVTQNALGLLDLRARENPEAVSIWNARSMFAIAGLLGEAMREVRRRNEEYLRLNNIDASATFIVGGQIAGEQHRLFLVYSEGNFIEASQDTNYFQIGEVKYGKPIIDRVLTRKSSLAEAVKLALVSFDSTMRSNISVGPPIDLLIYDADSLRNGTLRRMEEDDAYFSGIRRGWSDGLRKAFTELPDPDWK
jgi:putative proteasome-type protease